MNLISSSDPKTSIGRFLDRKGEGVFLVSVRVADVDGATAELRELGLTPLIEKPEAEEGHPKVNFVHPREMAGVQFEFIEAQD
jgi:methylmalonyl-CoA/ethylmalonyl-CoA epimerase